jgi:HlyD family secretion protein
MDMKTLPISAVSGRGARAGWVGLALAAWLGLSGCRPAGPAVCQGYIEGEYVFSAAPSGGHLTRLAVSRGATVQGGQLLFELDRAAEAAGVAEAGQRLAQARARLENLRKGRRPSELASIQAQLQRAAATLELAEIELRRRMKLRAENVVSDAELDLVRSQRDADAAQVATLRADLETARLGARTDEISAAEAEVESLAAAETRARWAFDQKRQVAPTNAWVHDTLFREGEFVGPGLPVVSLLPPGNLKVRFFVPQDRLATLQPGDPVAVSVDGRAAPLTATVSYISPQAEYTPPVIYSQENRAKMVFLVEARFAPDAAAGLHPGQPVDVRWAPARGTP